LGHCPKSALVFTNRSWGQNFTIYSLQYWKHEKNHW
jgi:hypothetical protein